MRLLTEIISPETLVVFILLATCNALAIGILYRIVNRRIKSVVSRRIRSLQDRIISQDIRITRLRGENMILALHAGCLELLDKRQIALARAKGKPDYSTEHPVHLQEKEYWLSTRLYRHSPILPRLKDKVTFKDYIREQLGAGFTPTTLGVWDRPEDIDFSGLPDRFALKSTIGYGNNHTLIVTDKAAFLRNPPIGELERWTHTDFIMKAIAGSPCMFIYHALKPRIMAEELLCGAGVGGGRRPCRPTTNFCV